VSDEKPTLKDFYVLVDDVEHHLLRCGESDWAGRLRLAVQSGATGGEILDNVGVVARELRATDVPARAGTQEQVEHIYRLVEEWYSK
jgi:hypothetical protein